MLELLDLVGNRLCRGPRPKVGSRGDLRSRSFKVEVIESRALGLLVVGDGEDW